MDSKSTSNYEVLRTRFEGREAVYMEKGALRVRVTNIHLLHAEQGSTMAADVAEIPTPGLGVGLFPWHRPGTSPCRWNIAEEPTSFSDVSWSMGNGGWCLFCARSCPGRSRFRIPTFQRRGSHWSLQGVVPLADEPESGFLARAPHMWLFHP